MAPAILTLNAGSSSLKFCLFDQDNDLSLRGKGGMTDIGGAPTFTASEQIRGAEDKRQLEKNATHEEGLKTILDWVKAHSEGQPIEAVAHRIVHGGTVFKKPVVLNPEIIEQLKKLSPLAPLHQPHNLAAVDIVAKLLPGVPQIACFDTAFHAHHEKLFTVFALPEEFAEKHIRRYGFHGLSYAWIAEVLKEDHPTLARGRIVIAHLGSGSSLCALQDAKSVDTTMSMTVLDGVPMATRSGAIDPGALIYMIRELGLSPDEVEHVLYEKSGLKGLSGLTNDVKTLMASSDPKAEFALRYFALKIAQYAAAMAASMGGIDGIVFTGGVGENAESLRRAILQRLTFMGDIPALVIPANEERMMAIESRRLLGKK